ncbi:Kv channel-interacting protein 4 [Halotydeus destructor]|nr:Kv channel-interacting protein 4 [Halotydeus destructor]
MAEAALMVHADSSSFRTRSSSDSSGDSATAINIRRFPFIRATYTKHAKEEIECVPMSPGIDSDLEPMIKEPKNLKYWTSKVSGMIKRMRGPSEKEKKKRASYESVFGSDYDGDFDDSADQVRIRPEAIDTLCHLTKFSRRELQLMYRGFKQDCPTGLVKEETFKSIYAQFFPRGADSSQYAHYVFNTFDPDRTGGVTFTDFVVGLSVLARGSVQDKLRWAFSLYDLNGDGVLTKDELTKIVNAIYDLMGRVDWFSDDLTTRDHVDKVFQKLDVNKNGEITMEEFLDTCLKDETITRSLAVFNTML